MKVIMREATSARSMPERRSAQAVSAMPPAPALAKSRDAAWPARLICVLVHRPMRERSPWATAEKSTMWPAKERISNTSARVSQRTSPLLRRSHTSGSPASAGAIRIEETMSSAAAPTRSSALRVENPPSERPSSAGSGAVGAATTAMRGSVVAYGPRFTGAIP